MFRLGCDGPCSGTLQLAVASPNLFVIGFYCLPTEASPRVPQQAQRTLCVNGGRIYNGPALRGACGRQLLGLPHFCLTPGRYSAILPTTMLMIRFQRIGRKNDPAFRMLVLEKTAGPKAGTYVDQVGTYNPKTKAFNADGARIKDWMSKGAQVSPSLLNLLIEKGVIEGKKTAKVVSKQNLEKNVAKKAAEEAAAKEAAEKAAADAAAAAATADAEVVEEVAGAPAEEAPAAVAEEAAPAA